MAFEGSADGGRRARGPEFHPKPRNFAPLEPVRHLLMTPAMAAIGGLLAFFSVVSLVVILPVSTYNPPPSLNWLPFTNAALRGRSTYLSNQCYLCHSYFVRPQDHFVGQFYVYDRVSEPGDYFGVGQSPNILGSIRTGPDLSNEGGTHPDDWHVAHYQNPRFTMPLSIMPRFNFWSPQELDDMIAFNQQSGGKAAVLRYATLTVGNRMMKINQAVLAPEEAFPAFIIEQIARGAPYFDSGHAFFFTVDGDPADPSPWGLPWKAVWMLNTFERSYWLTKNPLPLTQQNLMRGKDQFLKRCIGCHGVNGDGNGPAAPFLFPPPFNFHEQEPGAGIDGPFANDGHLYHRILHGGPGTAMESFASRIRLEDIWRIVLFLRTIQNGSLATPGTLPTIEMYEEWQPPGALLDYIDAHPLHEGPGVITETQTDPFKAAAHWLASGMSEDTVVLVGGKLPVTQEILADLIRFTYFDIVENAYSDALARGEALPPREQIFSTVGLTFTSPQ